MIFTYFNNLFWILLLSAIFWLWSIRKKDVSIVDIFWPLGFLWISGNTILIYSDQQNFATYLVFFFLLAWSLRLASYMLIRNLKKGSEDLRYQKIRAKHGPDFKFKSLYLIFGLQAGLVFFFSIPLQNFFAKGDYSFALYLFFPLALFGLIYESIADYQLFKHKKNHKTRLESGLWAFSKHPNYFGEIVFWQGIYGMLIHSLAGIINLFFAMALSILIHKISGPPMNKNYGPKAPKNLYWPKFR